jgi:hypothetical protein
MRRKLGSQRERSPAVLPAAEFEHLLLEDVAGGEEDRVSILDLGVQSFKNEQSKRGIG